MQEQQNKKRPPESSVPTGESTSKLAVPEIERGNTKRIKESGKATKRKKRFVL